ncbi:hypothetical protein SVIO_074000 [Streptomyces violaceusniger]|uniref:Uncharacterized protein n=1 Tax=Streptomyces violaceusniger TaxID=68280 RepID=A0A4D4LE33_STRVO|nr:hypothetical protein SVIO_074000 [Streptomyces violaceusniger]
MLDAVLQNTDNGVRTAQCRQPWCRRLNLRRLDGKEDKVDRSITLCRVDPHRPRHDDATFAYVQLEAFTRCSATHPRRTADLMQRRRHGRADRPGPTTATVGSIDIIFSLQFVTGRG